MESKSIALLNNATKMLSEVQTIDDAKNLMDIAAAAKHYAQKHGLGKEAVDFARSIEVSAELKLGEILTEMQKHPPGPEKQDRLSLSTDLPTFKELGISKDLAFESQALASLPEEDKVKLKAGKMTKQKGKGKARQKKKKEAIKAKAEEPIPESVMLYEGDFFEHIGSIKEKSIDLIIADPPYMVSGEEWDAFTSMEKFMDFTGRWLLAVTRTLKDTGRMFIFFSPDYLYDLFTLIKRNDFYGMEYANTIIWVKKNNNKKFDRKRYRLTYEPIFHLIGKDAVNLNFADETFGEIQTDVWTVATPQSNFDEGKYHPAQKPIEIYKRIIITASREGDTILDPFAGSGTTALVCMAMKRKCILIEKDAEYCNTIRGRINGMEREGI